MKLISSIQGLIIIVVLVSCKKSADAVPPVIPPYLTERVWQLDTILINPPATYENLTDEQKFNYNTSLAFSQNKAQLNFKNDGAVNCSGDWDYGYTSWQLINTDHDIKVNRNTGSDTLRTWKANATQFSYVRTLGAEIFDCTFIYK
ncbi:MAG: hypothetical protein ABI921_00740 [Panacibacter sp.]